MLEEQVCVAYFCFLFLYTHDSLLSHFLTSASFQWSSPFPAKLQNTVLLLHSSFFILKQLKCYEVTYRYVHVFNYFIFS